MDKTLRMTFSVSHPVRPPPDHGVPEPQTLQRDLWSSLRVQHVERVSEWVTAQTVRSSRGQKHPVYDFLFDYNNLRPSHLLHWHPGLNFCLEGEGAEEWLSFRHYGRLPGGIGADPKQFPRARRQAVDWILNLLRNCRERPPQFGCFGLHEWAMVYRSPDLRHQDYPLRLSPDRLAEVVEAQPIRCSHYDAFRFFTPAAQPLNQLQPTRKAQPDMEQRGCLHVNMDLLKWAHKLTPWTPSDLVADTFLLAARIREVDMRASPYDLRDLGFEPILIETPDGRAEYEQHQREFAALSIPLRDRLIACCEAILAIPDHEGSE